MGDNNGNGITEEDVINVQKSWEKVKINWKTVGPEFFMKLFKEFPEIKKKFTIFNGMSDAEIRSSRKLKAHAINFRLGISSYIENLGDLETVAILIQRTAASHFKRQIESAKFRDALHCFYDYLENSAKENSQNLESWSKVLQVVGDVIEQSMIDMAAQTDGE